MDGIVEAHDIDGRVRVLEVENSYRGMMSVIDRMAWSLRKAVTGRVHKTCPDDGVLLDEYCRWSSVFGTDCFLPSMAFLEVDGVVTMKMNRRYPGLFEYYIPTGVNGGLFGRDMRDSSDLDDAQKTAVSEWMSVRLSRFDWKRSHGLLAVDADWLLGDAPLADRIMAARTIRFLDISRPDGYFKLMKTFSVDPCYEIRRAVALNQYSPWGVYEWLAEDPDWRVRLAMACSCPVGIAADDRTPVWRRVSKVMVALLGDDEPEVRWRMGAEIIENVVGHLKAGKSARFLDCLLGCGDEEIRSRVMIKVLAE